MYMLGVRLSLVAVPLSRLDAGHAFLPVLCFALLNLCAPASATF